MVEQTINSGVLIALTKDKRNTNKRRRSHLCIQIKNFKIQHLNFVFIIGLILKSEVSIFADTGSIFIKIEDH